MAGEASQITEFALLRQEFLVPITEIRGDVRLILQRMDQQDQRAEEHRTALVRLDDRVDTVERTTITREELAEAVKKVRDDLAEQRAADVQRADRRLRVVAIVATIVVGLLGAGIAVIGIIAR